MPHIGNRYKIIWDETVKEQETLFNNNLCLKGIILGLVELVS